MLKSERQKKVIEFCERHGIATVKMIREELNVSDMTIRRDLGELDESGKLIRVHGGAQSVQYSGGDFFGADTEQIDNYENKELSRKEKLAISTKEKRYIAQRAAQLLDSEHETVFFGPGTTIELMTEYISVNHLRIVTNSLPVFNLLKEKKSYDLYLIGGSYRPETGAFVGSVADDMIKKIGIRKAFVGVNGIQNNWLSTFNIEEGKVQQLALDTAAKKYVVADARKFDHRDFYNFYDLNDIDGLFTDYTISKKIKDHYTQYSEIYT